MSGSREVATRSFASASMADLASVLALVDSACGDSDADAAFAVRLAAEEVFTNILEHGYRGSAGPVTVSIDCDAGRLRLVLLDEAAAFAPATAPAPDLDAALDDREPGGLGWHLVRQLMDEVTHAPRQPRGNIYTLTKRLPATTQDARGGNRP